MQNDSMGKWIMTIALVLILGAGILLVVVTNGRKVMMSIGGQVVYARVADTEGERARGLSGTSRLGSDEAMLLVFDAPGRWGIWMKDMRYNLDIVWLDNDKKVIYKAENISPDTYPTTFLPNQEARYVVELPAGFIARHDVGLGQFVGFTIH